MSAPRDRALAWAVATFVVVVAAVALVGVLIGRAGDDGACDPGDPGCATAEAEPTPEASPSATPTPEASPEPTPADPLAPTAGPDSTGVTAGRALAPHEPGEFDEDGLVLEGVHIVGDVVLTGDAQTVRDVRIDGKLSVRGAGSVVEDSEVGSLTVSGATSFTARRVEVFGLAGEDGIHVTSGRSRVADVVIEGCWIHSPQVLPESHYDGIQVRGVDRLTLRGNTFDLGPWNDRYNAAVFLEDANGGNIDVLVEDNWINGGGFSVYAFGTNVSLVGNHFGPDARWGLLYPDSLPFEQSGNVLAQDGSPVELE